jgi:hypothetical protein
MAMKTIFGVGALVFSAAMFLSPAAGAAEWHVTPQGKDTGDGTKANPWDLQTALKQPKDVKPGDTIWMHGGTYKGPFVSSLKGTEKDPIIVRQAIGEHAILDSGTDKRITLDLTGEGSDAWYWGFEIINTNPKYTFPPGPGARLERSNGVYDRAPRTKLINLIIHDTGMGMGHWSESPDSEIYGCISYFNGYANLDHGLYVQNEKGKKLISDNIFFGNASFGIHGYATKGFLNNMTFEGNISFNNGGLYRDTFGSNILVGASEQVSENPALIDNCTYFSPEVPKAKGSNNIGYHAGANNPTFKGNYFVTPIDRALVLINCKDVKMTGNTFVGKTQWGKDNNTLAPFTAADFPDNTYYTTDKPPKGVWQFVRPNKYETGRAHVAVYNWDKKDSIDLDLSKSGLKAGDQFEIRDVQNLEAKPVAAGVYDGKPVTVSLVGLTIAPTIAKVEFPFAHTSKEFNAFLVTKVAAK